MLKNAGEIPEMLPNAYAYFSRFMPEHPDLPERLEHEADMEEILIVGPVVGALLNILARV